MGIKVVGVATSALEALDLIAEQKPALLIAEWDVLAECDAGVDVLRDASASSPGLRSIVLATEDDPTRIEQSFAAGAAMYCVKTAAPEDLASAIRQSFETSIYHAGVRRTPTAGPASVSALTDSGLTKRETEILRLVAEGYPNSQLARMLWVTEQTVKFHLSNIYRKLNVANRTEASRWAQLHGLLAETASETAA